MMAAMANGPESTSARPQSSTARWKDISHASDDEIVHCLERNMSYRRTINCFAHLAIIVARMEEEGLDEPNWRQVAEELRDMFRIHDNHPLMLIFGESGVGVQCLYSALVDSQGQKADVLTVNRDYHDASFKKRLSLVMITQFKLYKQREMEEGHAVLFETAFQTFHKVLKDELPKSVVPGMVEKLIPAIVEYYREGKFLTFRDNTEKYMPFFKKCLLEFGYEVPSELDIPLPPLESTRSFELPDISSEAPNTSMEYTDSSVSETVNMAGTPSATKSSDLNDVENNPNALTTLAELRNGEPATSMEIDHPVPQPSAPTSSPPTTLTISDAMASETAVSAEAGPSDSTKPAATIQPSPARPVSPPKPASPGRVVANPPSTSGVVRKESPAHPSVAPENPPAVSPKVEEPRAAPGGKPVEKDVTTSAAPRNLPPAKGAKVKNEKTATLPSVRAVVVGNKPAPPQQQPLFQPDIPKKKSPEPAPTSTTSTKSSSAGVKSPAPAPAPAKSTRASAKESAIAPVDVLEPAETSTSPQKKQKLEEKKTEPPAIPNTSAIALYRTEAVANFSNYLKALSDESADLKKHLKAVLVYLLDRKATRITDFDVFKLPVSDDEAGHEYQKYIKIPLSLKTIAEELEASDMPVMELCNKLFLVTNNAMAFNSADTEICKVADDLLNELYMIYQDLRKLIDEQNHPEKVKKQPQMMPPEIKSENETYPPLKRSGMVVEGADLGPRGKKGRPAGSTLRKGSTASSSISSVPVKTQTVVNPPSKSITAVPAITTRRTRTARNVQH